MTFKELIEENIATKEFKYIEPYNTRRSIEFLKELKENSKNIVILADWDVDGIHSSKIVHNALKAFGVEKNRMEVYLGDKKGHGISWEFIREYSSKISYLIIVDSSTNSMEELEYLSSLGIKVLIIDHHIGTYKYEDYPENVILINSTMPNNSKDLNAISAGFLSFLVAKFWEAEFQFVLPMENLTLGYITLITDSCVLHDSYIKYLIICPEMYDKIIPNEVKAFMNAYDKMSRNFVAFKYGPAINNLCRSNQGDLILKYFFRSSEEDLPELAEKILNLKTDNRDRLNEMIETRSNYCNIKETYVLCNIDLALSTTELDRDYLINSTGLVAQKISEAYNKPTLAFISIDNDKYKFSGRDVKSEFNFLTLLDRLYLEGGGHINAAGFVTAKTALPQIMEEMEKFTRETSKKVYHVWDSTKDSRSILPLLDKVARYNEIAFGDLLPVYFKIKLETFYANKQFKKMKLYVNGDLNIKDLKGQTLTGEYVLVSPQIRERNVVFVEEIL